MPVANAIRVPHRNGGEIRARRQESSQVLRARPLRDVAVSALL